MTPLSHVLVFEGSDGQRVFVCTFCGSQAGPFPKDVPLGAIELYHNPECYYTEARHLTARLIIDKKGMS